MTVKAAAPPVLGGEVEIGSARLSVAFGRVLRQAGLDVPVSAVTSYAQALALVGLGRADHVFWAGHAVFVRRPEDRPAYSTAFASFWKGSPTGAGVAPPPAPVTLLADDDSLEGGEPEDARDERGEALVVRYSAAEILHEKDFATCSAEELAQLYATIASLRAHPSERPTRRPRSGTRGTGAIDLRRTVRRSLRAGGEPLWLHWLSPSRRPRRLVMLVDVSGSMEPYARAFLRFAHAAVIAGSHIEAFTLGTRLTRITRELRWRDPDAALRRASAAVTDIAGGTRLGQGLKDFNDHYGVSGRARGAVVVILSDGWDRGDPDQLSEEMGRLSRVAYRLVWVNPLKATPGYAPLARGMAAALPFVDDFVEGHSLGALERLVEEMGR